MLFHFPLPRLLLAAFVALISASCGKLAPVSMAEPILEKWVWDEWGYRSLGTEQIEQTKFHRERFGDATIRIESVKSVKEIEGMPGYFCSFVVCEETYPSVEEAEYRAENLHAHPPGLSSKQDAEFVLRDGFRVANRIIYASTHATLFHDVCMPVLIQNLKLQNGVIDAKT
ncbi:MAG: hypothetical protein P1U87_21630 [Verrucomicrobiales bacterium]|nr:hypothetical protein [Verrucomicrobiales bacterium]